VIHGRRRALLAAERLKSKAVSDVPRERTSDAGVAIAATAPAYRLHLTLLHRSAPLKVIRPNSIITPPLSSTLLNSAGQYRVYTAA
jgi:hypothetical protein